MKLLKPSAIWVQFVRIALRDIEAKKQLQDVQIQGKMLMNREELLKQLINDAKIVNIETVKTV